MKSLQPGQVLYYDSDSGCFMSLIEQGDGSFLPACAADELLDRHLLGRASEVAQELKRHEPMMINLVNQHFIPSAVEEDIDWDGFWPTATQVM